MVLPLPLVPFESYLLADDRPAYPMNCFARLRILGRLDRAALDRALSVTVSRHPLLGAVVRRRGRRDFWVAAEPPAAVQWLTTPPGESLPPLAPLDVRVAAGLRVVACEGAGGTDVTIQVHHVCCDGLGVLQFAKDLFVAYAQVCGVVRDSALRALRPEQLRGRGRFGLTAGRLLRILPQQAIGLGGARQFLMRHPEPLIPHRAQPDEGPPPPGYPASLTRQLDLAEWTGLMAAARRLGVTTNDLLARDFFLSVRDARRRTGADPGGWCRLTVPVNLRTLADRRLPAANVASMVFLDRQTPDLEDPQRLLQSIHEEMGLIKRLHLGLTFVFSVQVCRWLPGGLERMTRASRCAATGVLTNMGAPLTCCPLPRRQGRLAVGDAVLQSVDVLAPLRPLTCAALAVMVYAGRLHVTLHYDARVLTAPDARVFLDGFTTRVRQSADAQEPFVAETA